MARLIQVELWSDFISAGGTRELIIPLEQVFAASLNQDVRRAQRDLSLNVDARIAALFGGAFGLPTGGTFSQTTDGRVVQDDFTRADSNIIGAPAIFPSGAAAWTEVGESGAGDIRLNTNEANWAVDTPTTMGLSRTNLALPTEFIIQATQRMRLTNSFVRVWAYNDDVFPAGGSNFYDAGLNRSTGNFELRIIVGGAVSASDIVAVPGGITIGGNAPSAINYGMRMVGRTSGADFDLTGFMNSPLGSLLALSSAKGYAVAQIASLTDVAPILAVGSYGLLNSRRSFCGRIDACGVDFTMTSLPTGATIEVDGSTPVAESGGTAVLPMDSVPIPGGTLTVKESGGDTIGTLSPGKGLFGADEYDLLTAGSAAVFVPGAERKVLRLTFANGAVEEFRIN